jgi:hypothetical protein
MDDQTMKIDKLSEFNNISINFLNNLSEISLPKKSHCQVIPPSIICVLYFTNYQY